MPAIDTTTALSVDEIRYATRVSDRLRSELSQALETLAAGARSVRALANTLDIDRNTCQRVIAAAKSHGDPLDLFLQGPGTRGLRQFARAITTRQTPPEKHALETAVDAVDKLIRELAGSHSALVRRIRETRRSQASTSPGDPFLDARRRRFQADVEIYGTHNEVGLGIYAFRSRQDDPRQMDHAHISGMVGTVVRPNSATRVGWYLLKQEEQIKNLRGEVAHEFGADLLLEQFTSSPPPRISSKKVVGGHIQTVDPPEGVDGPTDLFFGRLYAPAGTHPRWSNSPVLTQRASVQMPTRHMVFDMFLEKEVAEGSVSSAGAYTKSANVQQNPAYRWYDRLPDSPRVVPIGAGLNNIQVSAYPRYGEVASYLFESRGWDPREFLGFRCEIQFPITGIEYAIMFQFESREESQH